MRAATITMNDAADMAERVMKDEFEMPQLGLTRTRLKGLPRTHSTDRFVLDRVTAALGGSATPRIIRALEPFEGSICRVLVDLLTHGRCNAAAWIILQGHVDGVQLPGGDGRPRTVMHPERRHADGNDVTDIIETHVDLGSRCHWIGRGRVEIMHAVPVTLLTACVGRPLSTIVSHPALDLTPMTITSARDNGTGGYMVDTDHLSKPEEERVVPIGRLTHEMMFPEREIRRDETSHGKMPRPPIE